MATLPFSANYGLTAAPELAGRCLTVDIGDSQDASQPDYLSYDYWIRALPLWYHYFVIDGSNNYPVVAGSCAGFGSLAGVSTGDCASAYTETVYAQLSTITGCTVASPGVVTTSANHGLVTGDTVTVSGCGATTTPTLDGSRTVTYISATTFSLGVNVSSVASPAGTVTLNLSTRIFCPARVNRFNTNIADNTSSVGSGLLLQRQLQNGPPGHNYIYRGMPWPNLPANSNQVWYLNTNMKAAILYWRPATGNLQDYAVWILKQAASYNANNYITNGTTAHSDASGTEAFARSAWSPVIRDHSQPLAITSNSAANPTSVTTVSAHGLTTGDTVTIAGQTGGVSINGSRVVTRTGATTFTVPVDCTGNAGTGGTVSVDYDVTSNGISRDHEVSVRINTSGTGFNESGKAIICTGAIFARCDTAGVLAANADGTMCAFASLSRPGSRVSSWLNYCTQADWQSYFAAVVLATVTPIVKLRFKFGHNLEPGTVDVSDGDGAQAEQAAGLTTTYWKKRYKALINRVVAGLQAAIPSAQIFIELEIPWVSTQSSAMATATLAADINTVTKQIASELGASWLSYYDALNASAPFYTLHCWTPAHGHQIAAIRLDAMNRATNFAYTSIGAIQTTGIRNRSWR